MKHYLGLLEYDLRQKGDKKPSFYNPENLINGHMLLCGMSGTGKSYQTMRFLNSAARSGIEIDIFDVHEELDGTYGATTCKYSQATGYGYNPLVLDTDPHDGGVDRQINFLVNLVKSVTPGMGSKQESALRYLLTDVYAASGIRQDWQNSWKREQITESKRNELIEQRQYQELRKYYPTMEDLKSYAKRKVTSLTMGGDNKAITAFDRLRTQKQRLTTLFNKLGKESNDDEIKRAKEKIESQKSECIDTYTTFINSMETGREIDDVFKYDSVDVLLSVIQRLDILNSSGIFRSNQPPFGNAKVRCHAIKSLTNEQQVMFVKLRLQEIFDRWKRVGKTQSGTEVRHVIFLDEAHKYFSDASDDIINVIAKEGRKFGVALWCASQQPTEFPESFLTNCGATVLLGIHSAFWQRTSKMMRITEDQLKYIKPKEVISVKLQRDGMADPSFVNIVVPNPNNQYGILAQEYER